jgi:hypothetical protein
MWEHRERYSEAPIDLRDVLAAPPTRYARASDELLAAQLESARRIIDSTDAAPPARPLDDPQLSDEFERIRWFPLPGEAGGSDGTRVR